jgi:hypothetical protein
VTDSAVTSAFRIHAPLNYFHVVMLAAHKWQVAVMTLQLPVSSLLLSCTTVTAAAGIPLPQLLAAALADQSRCVHCCHSSSLKLCAPHKQQHQQRQ